jgi:hypothetical protein
MKRYSPFLFILLLLTIEASASIDIGGSDYSFKSQLRSDSKKHKVNHDFIDVHYGVWKTDFGKLNQRVATCGWNPIKDQIKVVGISANTLVPVMSGLMFWVVHVDYNYFLPSQYAPTYSISSSLSGYSVGFGIGNSFFPTSKRFDLTLELGFQTGRMKLLWSNPGLSQNKDVYSNPFFSPHLVLEPRLMLGRISFGARIGYQYDVSKGEWRHTDASLDALGNAYLTGYILEAVLGVRIGGY